MASNITVDTLTKGATTLNTDEIVDTNSNQICKAWVNFNGSGTVAIIDSYNVSSVTDDASGQWAVNYTTAMSDGDYSVATCSNYTNTDSPGGATDNNNVRYTGTTKVRIFNRNTNGVGYLDPARVYCQVFGS
jgi:hypothetical protein